MARRRDILFSLALIGFFAWLFLTAATYPKQPRELPQLVSGIAIGVLIVRLVRIIGNPALSKVSRVNWPVTILVFGIMVAFVILIWLVGMVPAGLFLLYTMGLVFKAKNKVKLGIVTMVVVASFYAVFVLGAGILLPHGLLFDALGF